MGIFKLIFLLLLSSNVFALRCGNQIIDVGTPYYKVKELCNIYSENFKYVYIKQYNQVRELTIIDNKVYEVN